MRLWKTNPYLKNQRLADVIAAITTLGLYKFYKLDFAGWANRISGPAKTADHWEQVLREHPEFFRVNSHDNKASLIWRRQNPRNFDVDAEAEFLPDHQITGDAYNRISRKPLAPTEITALIGVAVNLHDRAIEQQKARMWWIPLATAVLAFAGGLLGTWIGKSGS